MKTQPVLVLLAALVAAVHAEPQDSRPVQVFPPSASVTARQQLAGRFNAAPAPAPPRINFAPRSTSAFFSGAASDSARASAPLAAPAPSFFLPGPVPAPVVFAPAPGPAPTPSAFAPAPPAPPAFVPTPAVFAPPAPEPSPAPAAFAPAPAAFAPAPAAFAPPAPAAFAPAPAAFAPAPAAFAPAPTAVAAPGPQRAPIIPLIRRTEVHDEAGQYALGFETGNGIIVTEQGALKRNLDGEWKDDFVLVKQGSFMYTAPDGRVYKVTYTADENGFHPKGSHLPVAPEVPFDSE